MQQSSKHSWNNLGEIRLSMWQAML